MCWKFGKNVSVAKGCTLASGTIVQGYGYDWDISYSSALQTKINYAVTIIIIFMH